MDSFFFCHSLTLYCQTIQDLKFSFVSQLKLMSDRVTFNECAKKSRHQKMTLVENITFMSQWYVCKFGLASKTPPVKELFHVL